MRIVITGASGNVGTALLLALGADRERQDVDHEHQLVGISRREPPPAPPYSWADWHCIDIGGPDAVGKLTGAFAGADVVVHLAWLLRPSRDREAMRRTNQDGTAAVVEAALAVGVGHLVHQSSIGAYSPGHGRTVAEDWPTDGIPTSPYSVDKAAAERIVDAAVERATVSRMRPALIFQDAAASEILRYFLGPLVPRQLIRPSTLRFVPFSDAIAFQVVHADDVASAIQRVIAERAPGAFNVAAPPIIDRAAWRRVFGGVGPPSPPAILRAAASATWHARLQPSEPGWIDMAAQVPFIDTGRISDLGWRPTKNAEEVLASFMQAMQRGSGRPGPLLERIGKQQEQRQGPTEHPAAE